MRGLKALVIGMATSFALHSVQLSQKSGSPTVEDKKWTEAKLVEHWQAKGITAAEGIYENTSTSEFVAKYRLGVLKVYNGFEVFYLSSIGDIQSNEDGRWVRHNHLWHPGDLKANLLSTATPGLYKAIWYLGDKSISQDVYVSFTDSALKVIWTDGDPPNYYLKLFPSYSDEIATKKQPSESLQRKSGTGFGIDPKGLVVTNHHVIEGATRISIRGVNGDFQIALEAEVLADDPRNDLAILKIRDSRFQATAPIPYIIRSQPAEVGESVFVLGYPKPDTMGQELKLTTGVVSAQSGFKGDLTSYQISAPIQPGNSGGPMFDEDGRLVGVVNAKHTGAENASYAIKVGYLNPLIVGIIKFPPATSMNSMHGKPLPKKVEAIRKFVYEIEVVF